MVRMTETEAAFLKLLDRYGAPFDVTSARLGKALKAAATSLLKRGHITGRRKALVLTDAGRLALQEDGKS